MKKIIFILVIGSLGISSSLFAQRVFIDAPSFYLLTNDVSKIAENSGLGLDLGAAVGTHSVMGKLSAGLTVTTDFSKEIDVKDGLVYNPFVKLEGGAGLYRSNGNKCSKTHASAYSLIGKAGVQYIFNKDLEKKFSPIVAIEASFFYIRDMVKNSEVFLEPQYNISTKTLGVSFGFRRFYNLTSY